MAHRPASMRLVDATATCRRIQPMRLERECSIAKVRRTRRRFNPSPPRGDQEGSALPEPATSCSIEWLRKQIEESAPDPLRSMLVEMVNLLMSAEVDEPRRRAEKALTAVVAEAHLPGVSTRKVEDLVQALGVERLSKSQVSQLAKELDGVVKSFRAVLCEVNDDWADRVIFSLQSAN